MPSVTSIERQRDFDAALAELVDRADRPADINRLVAAVVRLCDAYRARHAATVDHPATSSDCPPTTSTCSVPWCEGNCEPRNTDDSARLHTRSWPVPGGSVNRVQLGQLEATQGDTLPAADAAPAVWIDHHDGLRFEPFELTIDEADSLAAGLYKAVDTYRQAGR